MHDHSHAHPHHHHDHDHDHGHDHAHDHAHDHPGDHVFGQDKRMAGESRTAIVVAVTVVMMVVEIAAGAIYGSMALLADGLHMASHAVALGVTLVAYRMARAWAADRRFSFGVGKINALSGFSSALMLAGFAAVMAIESVIRFANPVAIQFDQALIVAVIGLVVNGASALLLGHTHDHGEHGHDDHDHAHPHHHDHNLRAAYLHVLADAMTSVLAIAALLAGKFMGWNWLDPVMGIVGAVLVANWSWGLMRQTGVILLDRQAPRALMEDVREAVEGHADHDHDHDHHHDHDGDDHHHDHHHPHEDGPDRVTDLHLWTIGPGIRAAEIVIESSAPLTPEQYRARIPRSAGVVHAVIEVNRKA